MQVNSELENQLHSVSTAVQPSSQQQQQQQQPAQSSQDAADFVSSVCWKKVSQPCGQFWRGVNTFPSHSKSFVSDTRTCRPPPPLAWREQCFFSAWCSLLKNKFWDCFLLWGHCCHSCLMWLSCIIIILQDSGLIVAANSQGHIKLLQMYWAILIDYTLLLCKLLTSSLWCRFWTILDICYIYTMLEFKLLCLACFTHYYILWLIF